MKRLCILQKASMMKNYLSALLTSARLAGRRLGAAWFIGRQGCCRTSLCTVLLTS